MEPIYWLTRQQEEAEMARGAASTEARLAHHELASRYGDKASQAEADTRACRGMERIPVDQSSTTRTPATPSPKQNGA